MKCRLLAIVITVSCIINLAGCSIKKAEDANSTSLQVNNSQNESIEETNGENDGISKSKVADEINKEDVIYNTVSGLKTNYAVSYVNSTTHQGSTTQYWNA